MAHALRRGVHHAALGVPRRGGRSRERHRRAGGSPDGHGPALRRTRPGRWRASRRSRSTPTSTRLPAAGCCGVGGEPIVAAVGGVRLAVVRDPNGVQVELMDDVARRNLAALADRDDDRAGGAAARAGPHWRVAIMGAGAGGLGLAIRLAKSGQRDFVLFEASDGVGGTWRANTYPGAACDVPSHLYCTPSPSSRTGARRTPTSPRSSSTSRTAPTASASAPISGRTPASRRPAGTRGSGRCPDRCRRRTYVADVLVSAIGTFTAPSVPAIEGLGSFAGPCFHSARWEHEHDLAGCPGGGRRDGGERGADRPRAGQGRRAGLGLPATPQWILPRSDKPFTEEEKRRFRAQPGAVRRHRSGDLPGLREADRLPPRRRDGRAAQGAGPQPPRVPDRGRRARAKLTPDYPFGCKRTLRLQ